MIRFLGGPANDVVLSLARQPIFLRVVKNAAGAIDALDQPDDVPELDEEIFVYRIREGSVSHGHMTYSGKDGRRTGRFFAIATYDFLPDQPPADVLRDTSRWRAYCIAKNNEPPKCTTTEPPSR